MPTIEMNFSEFDQHLQKKSAGLIAARQELLAKIGRIIERHVKLLYSIRATKAPTGRAMSSVHTQVIGKSVIVSDGTGYGIYLEMGTGIYGPKGKPITPVSAKALSFEMRSFSPKGGKSNRVVVKSVKGMRPLHIWFDAAENSVSEIVQAVAAFYEQYAAKS